MNARVPLDVASLSHPGMVRTHNEDSVFVDADAGLAVLADGMGGYSAGEVASGIAVNVISTGLLQELKSGRELSKVDIASGLSHAALLLQQQIAIANKGIYEAAQAKFSLNKNLVTRALGIEAVVPADIAEYRVEADDVYLMCSDGLTDMVEPDTVREVVTAKRTDLAEAAAELIDVANQNGGRDNISVILVRVPADFLPAGGWLQRWKTKKPA